MSDEMTYVADTLRRLADRMDTLEAWLPDGVTVTLTSGGVDALVVELVDGDEHYGSIDPGVLVGVERTSVVIEPACESEGGFGEPVITPDDPDVTPLIERRTGERKNWNKEGVVTTSGFYSYINVGLGDGGHVYFSHDGDGSRFVEHFSYSDRDRDLVDAAAWAEDMEAVDLETERRVPEVGEWYKRGGFLFLRVSENSCFDPVCGDIVEGLDFPGSSARHVIVDDMTPYLFGRSDQ